MWKMNTNIGKQLTFWIKTKHTILYKFIMEIGVFRPCSQISVQSASQNRGSMLQKPMEPGQNATLSVFEGEMNID